MKCSRYDFDEITNNKESKYIFQYVTNRKLTDVYHSHNFFEVCVILNGTATELFNGQKRLLTEGTVTILKPDDLHCFVDQSEHIKLICLSVESGEALQLMNAFGVKLPQTDIVFEVGNSVSRITNTVSLASDEHHYKLLFSQILTLLLDSQKHDVPYILKTAVLGMQRFENMQQGVPRLVELSGYSRSHLTRLVQKYYNASLQELVTRIRLEAAYNEVVFSKNSVEEITYKVGYSSVSHFYKAFKKTFGTTPAVLRKSNVVWTV